MVWGQLVRANGLYNQKGVSSSWTLPRTGGLLVLQLVALHGNAVKVDSTSDAMIVAVASTCVFAARRESCLLVVVWLSKSTIPLACTIRQDLVQCPRSTKILGSSAEFGVR